MNATPAFTKPPSPLIKKILDRIQNEESISFHDYMAMALYDHEHGYYSGKQQRVGKENDFITSVSVGSCFGMLLAQRIIHYWTENGKITPLHIIEPGAHDGSLCYDILTKIQQLCPHLFKKIHYHLIEATPSMQDAQRKKLTPLFSDQCTFHQNLQEINDVYGVILSNELIDAFPVEIVQFKDKQWHQLRVTSDSSNQDELTWTSTPIEAPHFAPLTDFPDGYTTEYNPNIQVFAQSASQALSSGLIITIDYGHDAEAYYHPSRTEGTLQTYHQHKKADNPLITPGEIDITSHVDFTYLIDNLTKHGFQNPTLKTQASYLTGQAKTWLLDIENPETPSSADTPHLIRQFQTLIHPAMLGTKFSVLEMSK